MHKLKVYKNDEEKTIDRNKRQLLKLLDACRESRKEDYEQFIKSYQIVGASPYTIHNHIASLLLWEPIINKEFNELQPADIPKILYALENTDLSQASKEMHKLNLRTFFKHIGRKDLSPHFLFKRQQKDKLPEDLLTKDEVFRLIDSALNPRDKAIISLLYESGARRGEILSLRLKHITPHERGFYVHFPKGKTGSRKILVVYSAMYINQWLIVHPGRENRESYLACSLKDGAVPINTSRFRRLLTNAANRAGIQKKVNPHSFRHAQATELAKEFTEQQMKNYLGWSKDSKMASVYVHLSGRDMDDAILRKNGIEIEERDTRLKPTECPRCHHMLPDGVMYCGFCGLPLSIEVKESDDEKIARVVKAILTDPSLKDKFGDLLT